MRSWERAHEKRLHGDLSTKAQRWRELGLEGEEQNGWVCDAPAVQRGSAQAGRQAALPAPSPHQSPMRTCWAALPRLAAAEF